MTRHRLLEKDDWVHIYRPEKVEGMDWRQVVSGFMLGAYIYLSIVLLML